VRRLDVCICTHNPRRNVLLTVARSIASQTVPCGVFGVLVVDNCSTPALSETDVRPIVEAGIEVRVVHEPLPGVIQARLRAVRETSAEWILFVDDDNELSHDFIETGLRIATSDTNLGCFGGKLLLADNLRPPTWVGRLLPFLGIKDAGDEPIVGHPDRWGLWEPPTAGAWVCRPMLELWRARVATSKGALRLGRVGGVDGKSLASCEDSLLMRGGAELGLAASYQPELILYHHLNPERFRFAYLIRLLYSYGMSHAVLDAVLPGRLTVPSYYRTPMDLLRLCAGILRADAWGSWRYALCMVAYHVGAFNEYHRCAASVR
jgi:glycosyltransferase involved in cell wall biosynthesis